MDADVSLILEHGHGWLLYVYIAAALVLSWWAWRRYGPAPAGLAGLVARSCRVAVMVVVIAALLAPAWRTVTTTTMPGQVVVAVDHSASMARADGPRQQPRLLSAGALAQALESEAERIGARFTWQRIGGRRGSVDPAALSPDDAHGQQSPLGNEISALGRSSHADALIVVSDFRVTEGSTLAVSAEHLRRLDVPVWALGVGSQRIDPELRLDEVSGNSTVALGERQPFTVRLSTRALPTDEPLRITVHDGDSEEAIASETIAAEELAAAADDQALRFERRLEVVLNEEGTRELTFRLNHGELQTSLRRQVEVSARRLQVLLLAHRPRYEMRYLQVALDRDDTVEVHGYLADGRWRRWTQFGPDSVPITSDGIRDYDVIIIGDLAPASIPPQGQSAIVSQVREYGAGLVWIPGESGNHAAFMAEELGSLLPVEYASPEALARSYDEDSPVAVRQTERARDAVFLDPGDGAWRDLPALRRVGAVAAVRDLASVWMRDEHDRPVVISAPFAAGTAVAVMVDDTWRWRRNVGDRYLHRFHSQILRFASSARASGEKPWQINAIPYRVQSGEILSISLSPSRPRPPEQGLPETVTVELTRDDDQRSRLLELSRVDDGSAYRGELSAPTAGSWRIALVDGLVPAEVSPGALSVLPPMAEHSDPRFAEEAMQALVEGTGGRAFATAEELAKAFPALARQQQNEHRESIWDNWWWFALITLLLAIEWALRRGHRLP